MPEPLNDDCADSPGQAGAEVGHRDLRISITIWLAAIALNVWGVTDAYPKRHAPSYCGESPYSMLMVVAIIVALVGLWRISVHWSGARGIVTIGTLLVAGAAMMLVVFNRPYGGCFD